MQQNMGAIVQKLRKTKGMTQEQLANLLGVSSAAVSKWETAHALPDVALLAPLARALGCTVNDLVDFRAQLTSSEIDTLCNSARRMFAAQNYQQAFDFCESRLREYPSDLNLAFRIGGLYAQYAGETATLRKTLHQRAIQLLEQATALPDEELSRTIWQMLAGLYAKNEEYQKALDALDHLPSCNARGRSLRASVLRQMGRLQLAAELNSDNLLFQLSECESGLENLAETWSFMGMEQSAQQLAILRAEFSQLKTRIDQLVQHTASAECNELNCQDAACQQ